MIIRCYLVALSAAELIGSRSKDLCRASRVVVAWENQMCGVDLSKIPARTGIPSCCKTCVSQSPEHRVPFLFDKSEPPSRLENTMTATACTFSPSHVNVMTTTQI